jgi:hypothetical protein
MTLAEYCQRIKIIDYNHELITPSDPEYYQEVCIFREVKMITMIASEILCYSSRRQSPEHSIILLDWFKHERSAQSSDYQ